MSKLTKSWPALDAFTSSGAIYSIVPQKEYARCVYKHTQELHTTQRTESVPDSSIKINRGQESVDSSTIDSTGIKQSTEAVPDSRTGDGNTGIQHATESVPDSSTGIKRRTRVGTP